MGRLTAVTAVLILIATGCGNDTVEVNPAPEATEAPATSTAVENETTTTESPAVEASPSEVLFASIDATVGRALRGQVSIPFGPEHALSIDFVSDAQGDSEISLPMDHDSGLPPDAQFRLRIVDDQMYFGAPAIMARQVFPDFAGDTAWLTIGPEYAAEFEIFACASPLAALGTGSGDCDPAADMTGLANAAEEGTVLGDEDVRGVPTTHLQFEVPLANLDTGAGEDEFGDQPPLPLEGNVALDVWIDDEMLIRKLVVDLSSVFGAFAEGFGAEDVELPFFGTVVEYYDFDESISIEVPSPESLLGDYADIQAQF